MSESQPTSGAEDGPITVRELSFDDPSLPGLWAKLFAASDIRPITQTLAWHKVWWSVFTPPRLLLLAADRGGETISIAPLYAAEGMVFFLGVGEADHHDFLGVAHDPDILTALLGAAMQLTPGFIGFKLHFVPESSRTSSALPCAAERLGLNLFERGDLVSVSVDIAANPDAVRGSVSRSMRKAENYFRHRGNLTVEHLTTAAEVLPRLPEFYDMHIARWRLKGIDSAFLRPERRRFLECWVEASADGGWLRFVRLDLDGTTLGMDLNWHFETTQFSGQWVFAIEYLKQSPGQVLLRQSVLMALEAGMRTYDLGLGDQAYKFRLPSQTLKCVTWGLYPP
jgi:CelD/BcsL family acetyltransferase involved in cellulose biosynthesis